MANFTPHTENDVKEMLEATGVSSVEELFADIPQELRAKSFNLPLGETEYEVLKSFRNLAGINKKNYVSFLGGGYYDHYIPAVVDAI